MILRLKVPQMIGTRASNLDMYPVSHDRLSLTARSYANGLEGQKIHEQGGC